MILYRILASPVRNLDPLQFEEFTALYIKNRGYYQIDLTPVSGDFGADIIAYNPQGKKVCIQCKKYSNPVGVSAVQEILSAKLYYQCEIAMVAVTSAGYTRQAKELAKKTGVLLYTFDDVLHEFVSADKQTIPSTQQDNSVTLPRIPIESSTEAYTSNTVPYTGKEYNKNEVNTINIVDAKRTGHENTISIREKQKLALLIQPRIACNAYHTIFVKLDGTLKITNRGQSKAKEVLTKWTNIVAVATNGKKIIGLRSNGILISVDTDSGRRYYDWSHVVALSKKGMFIVQDADSLYIPGAPDKAGNSIAAVSEGKKFIAALRKDGTVFTWRNMNQYHYNYEATLAHLDDTIPDVSTWNSIVAIDAGEGHLVGLKANGTVVASGNNECGQCNVSDWSNIIAIAAGDSHTVGVTAQGEVLKVGSTKRGPCNVTGWNNIVSIVAMGHNTFGVKADGQIVGCGEDIGYGYGYGKLFNSIETIKEEMKMANEQMLLDEQKRALSGLGKKEIELKNLELQYEEARRLEKEANDKRVQAQGIFKEKKRGELLDEVYKYSGIASEISSKINQLKADINHNWED